MTAEELRKALAEKATEGGVDPDALERMALRLALGLPADMRRELTETMPHIEQGYWPFIGERAGRSALVAMDQALGTERRQPPTIRPRLRSAPRIREFFWCDYPDDAQLPEFWKTRPVIVVSYRNKLSGAVTVVPCSTADQHSNPWAFQLPEGIDGTVGSWAVCNQPTSVAVSRLSSAGGGIRRLPEAEFNRILALVLAWLPKVPLD